MLNVAGVDIFTMMGILLLLLLFLSQVRQCNQQHGRGKDYAPARRLAHEVRVKVWSRYLYAGTLNSDMIARQKCPKQYSLDARFNKFTFKVRHFGVDEKELFLAQRNKSPRRSFRKGLRQYIITSKGAVFLAQC